MTRSIIQRATERAWRNGAAGQAEREGRSDKLSHGATAAGRWIIGSLLALASCAALSPQAAVSEGVQFDHVVVFASGPGLQSWLEQYFTNAEALDTRHEGQGTRGRYFLFLNSFLEVLTLEDAAEARANEGAFGSRYVERWTDRHAAPLAVGLTLSEESFASPPFAHVRYRTDDEEGGYVMSEGNADLESPLVYATGPARAFPRRKSIDEVNSIEDPGRREAVRRYLTHPSGALSLTRVVWRAPTTKPSSSNAELARNLPEVTLEDSIGYELVLEFDDRISGEEVRFEGRPSVVLRF
ncbi:MAG: hypothetical protein AAGG01_23165 [Planctomycetota bacterium]